MGKPKDSSYIGEDFFLALIVGFICLINSAIKKVKVT